MTPAEFKTIRESLGLSCQDVANWLGLKRDRSIQHWENPNGIRQPPKNVCDSLRQLNEHVDAICENVVEFIKTKRAETGDVLNAVKLIRYITDDHFSKYMPEEDKTWPSARKIHCSLLGRVQRELKKVGILAEIVFFIPEEYEAWLKENGRSDDHASRAAWAGTQGRG